MIKKILLAMLPVLVIIGFVAMGTAFDKKPNDCPKLSLEEQGHVLNDYLYDYDQWKNFKEALRIYGYCLSQFGLKSPEKIPTAPSYKVVQLESSADVTLWLNENNPSEIIDIETTGFLWWVFYKK